jgi:histidinol-phosphate/aromatic aminotransferase/cobyric acid decarboxylase-like protein
MRAAAARVGVCIAIPSIIRKATRLRNPICASFLLFAFTLTASRVLRPLVQMENAKERANDEFWAR